MLKTRLVRKEDAEFQFEVMAHLIHQFGPPARPLVPSPLRRTPNFETLFWTDNDARTVYNWAKDNFAAIQTDCHMRGYEVELFPAGEGLDAERFSAARRLEALAAGQMPYHETAAEPIFFDPRDCAQPGHFAANIVLQLAELRLMGFKPKTVKSSAFKSRSASSNLLQRMALLSAAVYNRQGFVLANLPRDVSIYLTRLDDTRAVPERMIIDTLCFATCLALRVRRQTPEQIIGTYGTRMSKPMRRKIRQACRQIDMSAEGLAVLQMLSERKPAPQMRRLRA